MADITMCHGDGCKVKNICHRSTAFINLHYQSFFAGSPGKDEKCEYFISTEKQNDKPLLSRTNKTIPTKGV